MLGICSCETTSLDRRAVQENGRAAERNSRLGIEHNAPRSCLAVPTFAAITFTVNVKRYQRLCLSCR